MSLDTSPQSKPLHYNLDTRSFSPTKRDVAKVGQALEMSWAPSTRSAYSRNIQHFIEFCDSRDIPTDQRLPTPESILTIYTASHLGQYAASTVQQRLSALKYHHIINNLPWSGSDRIQKMMRGIKTAAPVTSTKKPRQAISISMLLSLINNLDLFDPFDAAVAACACTAFWGQCRLGELLPSTPSLQNSHLFPTRAHLSCSASQARKNDHFKLTLPHTKTSPLGQTITLLPQQSRSDPLRLLRHHLAINPSPLHTPLFAYMPKTVREDDSVLTLTKDAFLLRCNQIWVALGYDRITGHSFRIGGTTTLLSLGIPPDVVKTMGRWSSDSFLRYWRHIDRIAKAQTPSTPRKPKVSRSQYTINSRSIQ